jgi:hypothetical protein
MREQRCDKCKHYVAWVTASGSMYYDSDPDGVCTAPRPLLGPAPNREVKSGMGKNCPMWGGQANE